MSIVISRSLFCDFCPNWYDAAHDPLALAPVIRREAARYGWKRRGGKDACPDCSSPSVSSQEEKEGETDGR